MRTTEILAHELNGHLLRNDEEAAMPIARKLLRSKSINAHVFDVAVHALLQCDSNLRNKVKMVLRAHSRLPPADRACSANTMFHFYVGLEDWTNARELLPDDPDNCYDLLFSMRALLGTDEIDLAGLVANQCLSALDEDLDEFENVMVAVAMAEYSARIYRWNEAEDWWMEAIESEVFRENAVEEIVCLRSLGLLKLAEIVPESAILRHRCKHLKRIVKNHELRYYGL